MTEDTQTQRTTWTLANLAGCAGPDRPDRYGWENDRTDYDPSAGAVFLRSVESSTEEALEYGWNEDAAHEVADGCVPVYTSELWSVFVDVAAWTEDPSELGMEGTEGMEHLAGACLYIIGRRLAEAIAEETEDDEDDDEDGRN